MIASSVGDVNLWVDAFLRARVVLSDRFVDLDIDAPWFSGALRTEARRYYCQVTLTEFPFVEIPADISALSEKAADLSIAKDTAFLISVPNSLDRSFCQAGVVAPPDSPDFGNLPVSSLMNI